MELRPRTHRRRLYVALIAVFAAVVLGPLIKITGHAVGDEAVGCGGPLGEAETDPDADWADTLEPGIAIEEALVGEKSGAWASLPKTGWQNCKLQPKVDVAGSLTLPVPTAHYSHGFDDANITLINNTGSVAMVPGRSGKAMTVTGGVATLPFNNVFDLGPNGGAIAFWVRNNKVWGHQLPLYTALVMVSGAGVVHNINIGTDAAPASLRAVVRDDQSAEHVVQVTADDWSPGQWRHVTLTWGGGRVRMFVDGRLEGIKSGVPANLLSTKPLPAAQLNLLSGCRGNKADGTCNIPGKGEFAIDLLHTYNHDLTQDEVVGLYQSELDRAGPLLEAGRLQMKLLGQRDGWGVQAIGDDQIDRRITMQASSRQLWRLRFSSLDNNASKVFTLDNKALSRSKCEFHPTTKDIRLTWDRDLPQSDFNALDPKDKVVVRVLLSREASLDELQARILVMRSYAASPWTLDQVALRLGGLAPVDSADTTQLILPSGYIGNAVTNPFAKIFVGSNWRINEDSAARYPSGQMAMPWAALLNTASREGGVYFAAHDKAWLKALFYRNPFWHEAPGAGETSPAYKILTATEDQGLDMEVVVYPEHIGSPTNGYQQDWPVVIHVQDGDWYDMARYYRTRFALSTWAEKAMPDEKQVPQWFRDLGYVAAHSFESSLSLMRGKMRTAAGCTGTGDTLTGCLFDPTGYILWHRAQWNIASANAGVSVQTNDLPFYDLAPEAFTGFNANNYQGTRQVLYTVPSQWDIAADAGVANLGSMDYSQWQELEGRKAAMIRKKPDPTFTADSYDCTWQEPSDASVLTVPGTLHTGAAWTQTFCPPADDWNTTHAQEYDVMMCPYSAKWQDLVAESYGGGGVFPTGGLLQHVAGIYTDTIAAMQPEMCWSKEHGHPAGGGTHFVEGTRAMLQKVRNKAQPEHVFYAEGFADPFVDLLTGFLVMKFDLYSTHPLPLALAVYHDRTAFIGREIWPEYPGNNYTTQDDIAVVGQAFAWGILPGFAGGGSVDTNPDHRAMKSMAYQFKLARYRRLFQNYLLSGDMLRPPAVSEIANAEFAAADGTVKVVNAAPGALTPIALFGATLKQPNAMIVERVVASLWAYDNSAGLVVASLEQKPQTGSGNVHAVYIPLESQSLGKTLGTTQAAITRVMFDGSEQVIAPNVTLADASGIVLELQPEEVALLRITGAMY